jgi:hypothetical protein
MLKPVLYLLPLMLLPDQLGYVEGRTSNRHQLQLLQKIEAFSDDGDAVIDGAGGALFRPHGSYYWYHGGAHRKMFREYFGSRLVQDYRDSRALFWIHDFRQRKLPTRVQHYFSRHYVHADGELYALGFTTPATGNRAVTRGVDVVREGTYYVHTAADSPRGRVVRGVAPGEASGLKVDGAPIRGGAVHLAAGKHRIEIPPRSPRHLITPLPVAAFAPSIAEGLEHSPLFEFGISQRDGADS